MVTRQNLIDAMSSNIRAKERSLDSTKKDLAKLRDSFEQRDGKLTPEQSEQLVKLAQRRDELDSDLEAMRIREGELVREQAQDDIASRVRQNWAQIGSDGVVYEFDGSNVREYRPGADAGIGGAFVSDASTYRRDNAREVSFFRDLRNARYGDADAADRLRRNEAEVQMKTRSWTSSPAGSGGTFAPPAWLTASFIEYARPGRVTADLLHRQELPSGISSINLPKISTGAGVAVQVTQNTTITESGVTTTSVTSTITTIAGGQLVSVQMLEQGGTPMDEVILQDLAAAYAVEFDDQVLNGSGVTGQLRGVLTVTAGSSITFTTTQPTVVSATSANSFYAQVVSAAAGVNTLRYAPADAIVMHPRRWAWVLSGLDKDDRPLVVPTANYNAPGVAGAPAAQGEPAWDCRRAMLGGDGVVVPSG